MKRFLLFGWFEEPQGGWGDFILSFDTCLLAEIYANGIGYNWWQVIDSKTETVVVEMEM
jgi:hypothetical protein